MNKDASNSLNNLLEKVEKFVKERDWDKYHTPKNLAMSIAIEAAEILELFQWVTIKESIDNVAKDEKLKTALAEEIADVMIYTISLALHTDIDLEKAIIKKLEKNEVRFPINAVKGKLGPYKINQ